MVAFHAAVNFIPLALQRLLDHLMHQLHPFWRTGFAEFICSNEDLAELATLVYFSVVISKWKLFEVWDDVSKRGQDL